MTILALASRRFAANTTDQSAAKESRARVVVSLSIFRLVLDACIFLYAAPEYATHFLFRIGLEVNLFQYVFSWIIYLAALLAIVGGRKTDIVNLFSVVAILFCLAPIASVYGLDSTRAALPVVLTAISICVAHFVAKLKGLPQFRFQKVRGGSAAAMFLSAVAVAFYIGFSIVSGAYVYLNFDFTSIYVLRPIVSSLMDVGMFAYVNVWTTKVLGIFLFCIAIHKKWYSVAVIVLICQIYFFAITSHRGLLFIPVLAGGMILYFRSSMYLSTLIVIAASMLLATLLMTVKIDLGSLDSVVIRRAFFVPASATYEWFSYFDQYAHVYWADKLLAAFVSNEYTGKSLPFLLGDYLAADKDVGANNGLVSCGYAHLGIPGVLIYAVIFGLVLRVVRGLERSGVPLWMVAAIMINPIRTVWTASDLPTSLITHGILIGIVLLALYGRGKQLGSGLVKEK